MRTGRRSVTVVGILAVVALLAAACGGDEGGTGDALRALKIVMSTDSPGIPGPWIADELGYYKEEGISVSIVAASGSSASIQQGIAQKFDLMEGFSDAALTGMASTGAKLYPFYTDFPVEIREWSVVPNSSIKSVNDLRGTKVGLREPTGGEVILARYILQRAGIDPDKDVSLTVIGKEPAGVVAALNQKRVDSYVSTTQQVTQIEASGFKLRSIFPDDIKDGPVSAFYASETIAKDRDLLVRFGRATAKGTLFCIANFDACLDVIGKKYPERVTDRPTTRKVLENFAPTWTNVKKDDKFVFSTANTVQDWKFYLDAFSTGKDALIKNPEAIDLESLVLDITDEINDFDYDAVVRQAETYKSS